MKEIFYRPLSNTTTFCEAPACRESAKFAAKKHRKTYYFCEQHLRAWAGENKLQIAALNEPPEAVLEHAWEQASDRLGGELARTLRELKLIAEKYNYYHKTLLCIAASRHYPDCPDDGKYFTKAACECPSHAAASALDGSLIFKKDKPQGEEAS